MKIKVFQDKYNTARKVLITLGVSEADMEWKEIKHTDLPWCLEDDEMNEKCEERRKKLAEKLASKANGNAFSGPGPGEGHRVLSWIWEGARRYPDMSMGLNEGEYNS
jgi:hypothetical protein